MQKYVCETDKLDWLNLRLSSSVGTNSSEVNQREVEKGLALNAKEVEVYLLAMRDTTGL